MRARTAPTARLTRGASSLVHAAEGTCSTTIASGLLARLSLLRLLLRLGLLTLGHLVILSGLILILLLILRPVNIAVYVGILIDVDIYTAVVPV